MFTHQAINEHQIDAVRFNNSGVCAMEAGDFEESIRSLTCALKACKGSLVEDENGMAPPSGHECSLIDQCMLRPIPSSSISKGIEDPESNNVSSIIYRCAVHMPEEAAVTNQNTSHTMSSAIIMFNMALAHHLSGIEEASLGKQRKAIKLYTFTYDLLKDAECARSPSLQLFAMACINNLGQLYQSLGEQQIAEGYYQHMLSVLILLIDSGEGIGREFTCFLQNASHALLMGSSHTSAAAA
jgi:tetratricopeptide (TPR) repeat protein